MKKAIPHLIAIGIFLIIAIVYCQPAFQGKVLSQQDVIGWKGMAQQSFEYKEKNGHFPLWNISLFSGMPAFQIAMEAEHNIGIGYLYSILSLWLPKPANFFFLSCLCFYFLCLVLRTRQWIAIIGAIAYTYASFTSIIIAVGHDSQMQALALAPAVIASLLLLYQGNLLTGCALLAIFSGLLIGSSHLQIVYYTLLIILILTIVYFIHEVKQKRSGKAITAIGIAAFAGIIGALVCSVTLLPTYDYAKETMRGGVSELTADQKNKTKGGLDKDYAFEYSYGPGETFTLVVPNIYGGGTSGRQFTSSTRFTEKLSEVGVPEENALQMEDAYSYWGDQPILSGPVYLGAVICFLFIFGLVYLRTWHKWWIVPSAILGILMAWGHHLSSFNYLLFDYLPFYNKFRAPSMALVIPQLMFPLLGALAVDQLISAKATEETWKKFRLSVLISAGLFVVLAFFYFSSDFKGKNDNRIRDSFTMQLSQGNTSPQVQQQAQSMAQSLVKALQEDRKSLYGKDLLRSIVLVGLAILLIGAYLKNRLKPLPLMIALLILVSYDVLAVGRRYLNTETFVEPQDYENIFQPTTADLRIKADPDKPFRVYDNTAAEGPYNSSRASYFHNSVGGYHPAKLGLYQDLIEHQLSKGNMQVFNMLNTRYFITQAGANGQAVAQRNPSAFGPAWIVKAIKYVAHADQEMKALDSTNLKDTAIVQEKFRPGIKFQPQADSTASIRILQYSNDTIKYEFNSKTNQFVVFSEIYYPRGWNAYLDGNKAEYVKADYVLRGMSVPAGKHTIEFRFEPKAYKLGNTLTLISTLVIFALLAIAAVQEFRKKKLRA